MKKARIYWDGVRWVLELFKDDDWHFSIAWIAKQKDYGDMINDSILCKIAELQEFGYDVKVYFNNDYV